MGDNSARWTEDRDARLCALRDDGWTSGAIADELGITRNAVMGRINRLRMLGDPRIPPAGVDALGRSPRRGAPTPRRASDPVADRLADAMADGCPTLFGAALRLQVSIDRVEQLWARICRDLGWQAA